MKVKEALAKTRDGLPREAFAIVGDKTDPESWKLPPSLIQAIRHHHDEEAFATLDATDGRMAALVSLASHSLARLGVGRPGPCEDIDLTALPAWSFLDLPAAEVDALIELCEEQVEAAQAIGG